MSVYMAQVNIPMKSGILEDAVTNTWHFEGSDAPDVQTTVDDIVSQLTAFYQAIDGSLFSFEVGNLATVKIYNLGHALPRQIVHQDTFALVVSGTIGLPHECAITLSFAGDVSSGDNPAHRRGRIFIGPVPDETRVVTANKVLIQQDTITTLATAAAALQDAGSAVCQWVIYSPTWHKGRGATPANPNTGYPGSPAIDPHALGDSAFNVSRGWVDNSFDTIRSRGEKATNRTTWD